MYMKGKRAKKHQTVILPMQKQNTNIAGEIALALKIDSPN
jgi:hypothetical protein